MFAMRDGKFYAEPLSNGPHTLKAKDRSSSTHNITERVGVLHAVEMELSLSL